MFLFMVLWCYDNLVVVGYIMSFVVLMGVVLGLLRYLFCLVFGEERWIIWMSVFVFEKLFVFEFGRLLFILDDYLEVLFDLYYLKYLE